MAICKRQTGESRVSYDDDVDPEQDPPEPMQGQVRFSNLSARVPEHVGFGTFSNGVLILTGPHEFVLDFSLRMGELQRIVARVVLPHAVTRQFLVALQENVRHFERNFGRVPAIPRPQSHPVDGPPADWPDAPGGAPAATPPVPAEPGTAGPSPSIDDIYAELRLPDNHLSGSYANAVLIRHSPTEFCFDFITNIYPRSGVSSRVFMSAPHVPPLLASLARALDALPPE
jgi:hypothetical protein